MRIMSFALVMILVLSTVASCVSTPEPVVETEVAVQTSDAAASTEESLAEPIDATSAASDENWESPTDEMTDSSSGEGTDATTAASEPWE
jgi:hypothetical protein